jgi:hypothetical protein
MTVETFEPIGSSHIQAASYDRESEDLTITFQDGSQYLYRNVPPSTYRSLTLADSVGSFFHRNIRSRYLSEQV